MKERFNFIIHPRLETERLVFRKLEVEDFPLLVRYANSKAVSDNIINIPHPYSELDASMRLSYVVQGFKAKTRFVFAIEWKETKEFIGEISHHLDDDQRSQMGYWIGEPYWGKGIISEAVSEMIQFGFQKLQLQTLYATCYEENKASSAVLIKNGMKRVSANGRVHRYEIENTMV